MPYKDREPFLAFGGKIDPLSEIRNAGIVTSGDVFWVKAPGDTAYTTVKDAVGAGVLRDDIQAAVDLTATDENDYVFVAPRDVGTPWGLGTALDLNEDRMHLIALGYNAKPGRTYSALIEGSYGTSPDTEVVAVTGQAVEIAGFNIRGTLGTNDGGTMSNAVLFLGTASTGTAHDLWVHNCTISINAAQGTPPLVAGLLAADVRFEDVLFDADVASNIQGVLFPASAPRWEFHNCRFLKQAQAVGDQFAVSGTGAIGYHLFKDCTFLNRTNGTAIASAVTGSVTVATNGILMQNCSYLNVTEAGTDPGVFVVPAQSGTSARVVDPGLAIGSAALVAN